MRTVRRRGRSLILIGMVVLGVASASRLWAQTAGPSPVPFVVSRSEGQVLHVPPDGPPRPAASGARLTSGRLVVMDDAAAEVVFPNGRSFAVPPGTVLYLDSAADTLENACAGTMAIRDRTVVFVHPAPNAVLPVGKTFEVLLGLDPGSALVRHVGRFVLVASGEDDEEIVLGRFAAGRAAPPESNRTVPRYRLHRVTTGRGLPAAGPWEISVRTVEEPAGQTVGRSLAVLAR